MGWLCYNSTELYSNGKVNRKKEMDKISTWDSEHSSARVLSSVMYGRVYYAALEITNKDTGVKKVTASVCLTCGKDRMNKHSHNFGYKDMDETMGPCYYDCPEYILRLLSPTDNKEALLWRERCHKTNWRKKLLKSAGRIHVMFNRDIQFNFAKTIPAGKWVTLSKEQHGHKRKRTYWVTEDGGYMHNGFVVNCAEEVEVL